MKTAAHTAEGELNLYVSLDVYLLTFLHLILKVTKLYKVGFEMFPLWGLELWLIY